MTYKSSNVELLVSKVGGVDEVSLSFVLDNKEHEIVVDATALKMALDSGLFSRIKNTEFNFSDACCEHPDGCP